MRQRVPRDQNGHGIAQVAGRAAASRRKTRCLPVLIVALVLVNGCRAKRIWTGIEFRTNGTLRLAAEEPMCGCFSVVNATNNPVRLRASLKADVIGEAVLKAAERQRFKFDWAGAGQNDFYEIEVFSSEGPRLDARKVLEADDRPRWVECEAASCELGDLQMGVASGER